MRLPFVPACVRVYRNALVARIFALILQGSLSLFIPWLMFVWLLMITRVDIVHALTSLVALGVCERRTVLQLLSK